MLGTPKQMNDHWNEIHADAHARNEVHETALRDLENDAKAMFFGRNGEDVEIDLMDTIEERQDDELWALLTTFWQKKRNGTQTEVSTAMNKLFEKLDREVNDSLETFL